VNVEIDLPADWRRLDTKPPLSLLAQPATWHGSPVPTISVVDTEVPGDVAFDDYVQAELVRASEVYPGHLVHLDVDAEGRRFDVTMAFEQLGADVTSVQRHVMDGDGRTVVATGVAADDDWPDVARVIIATVRSIRTAG
jgi:hypothetical protein